MSVATESIIVFTTSISDGKLIYIFCALNSTSCITNFNMYCM